MNAWVPDVSSKRDRGKFSVYKTMMTLFFINMAFLLGNAAAFQPPVGWTSQGPNRAMLDPKDPLKGELYEFTLPAGAADAKALVAALQAAGVSVQRFGSDGDGATNLVLENRLGRARSEVSGQSTIWWVVLVGNQHAPKLDPDGLLQAMAPPPQNLSWGQQEVLPGGQDGSPWGEVQATGSSANSWANENDLQVWGQDPAVIGVWEGQAATRLNSTTLRFRFENTGLLQVQSTDGSGESVVEGQWSTRGQLMQMNIEGGGSNLPYHATNTTLSISWQGQSVSLYKR